MVSPQTNPIDQPRSLNPQNFIREVYAGGKTPAYPREIVERIANAIASDARIFSYDGPSAGGQILEETNYLRFGGDVLPEQYNLAGLGATGGGVRGASFSTPEDGVRAVFLHLNTYFRGKKENWPVELQALAVEHLMPRYRAAVSAGYAGMAKNLAFLATRWAKDPQYANKIAPIATALEETKVVGLRLVFASGHRNASGGHARETALTGELTEEYYRIGRSLGHDVRVTTPDGPDADTDPGDGTHSADLFAAAQAVVKWAEQGWVADYFIENHYQGLHEGSDSGKGHFIIHPDWGSDVDTDVRDGFGPLWARIFQQHIGMSMWTDGVMSEKQTGVGIDGYRLGVFRATENLRQVTRAIIEHGSHTSPADMKFITRPDFNVKAAQAFYIALHQYHKLPAPNFAGVDPVKPPIITPGRPSLVLNGFWIVDEFQDKWESLGNEAFSVLGPPKSGMFLGNVDGTARLVQIFEKGALGHYPEEAPHGVPRGNPMRVRNLLPWEREAVLAWGKEQGFVAQDVL
jgi:hypothetical protein